MDMTKEELISRLRPYCLYKSNSEQAKNHYAKMCAQVAIEYSDQENKAKDEEIKALKELIQVSEDKYREVLVNKALKFNEITQLKEALESKGKEVDVYAVTFDGKDEQGIITKSINIVAENRDSALRLAKELNDSTRIYSAIKRL